MRCGLGPAPLAEVKVTQGWGQAGTVLVGLDLNAAVRFEWLIFAFSSASRDMTQT